MAGTALLGASAFVEYAARERRRHYRHQAARFRSLAEVEPLRPLRRRLLRLAQEYDQLADEPGQPPVAGTV